MGSASIFSCCCVNSPCSSMHFPASRLVPGKRVHSRPRRSFPSDICRNSVRFRASDPSVRISASQEILETTPASGFVETGYIFGVHGLKGEVRVKPTTDFPELRFSTPGTRWLKQQASGSESLKEIELVEGRGHPGQSWIIKFNGISTVEQAQKLVGSRILVTDQDRPDLEEGDFYTRDLIGMAVVLKESGEVIGTVVSVINSGASDLLHVELKSKTGTDDSGPLVWIPFVEEIVPIVDLEKREMVITPPKGLLELNIPRHDRSKKERRELEWKVRKKYQRRLIAAKKKLCEMEQQHVFHGFQFGDKVQRSLLADQIVSLNSKLLQQALQSMKSPASSLDLLRILSSLPASNVLRLKDEHYSSASERLSDTYLKLQREGCVLMSSGKIAVVLVLGETEEASISFFNDHGIKVWHLPEETLPVVSDSLEGENKHKILMKSPWELLQSPVGSGAIISLLSSQDSLLDQLSALGVEFIAACKVTEKWDNIHALAGLVNSLKADVSIRIYNNFKPEEDFSMVFSMSFLRKVVKQVNQLQFDAIPQCSPYASKLDNDWVDVVPVSNNSYMFHCSIYSCLNSTPSSKLCIFDSSE